MRLSESDDGAINKTIISTGNDLEETIVLRPFISIDQSTQRPQEDHLLSFCFAEVNCIYICQRRVLDNDSAVDQSVKIEQ